jgi:hypothetical protein
MSKYTPLSNYLKTKGFAETPLTFREVEKILGTSLPPSAYEHRAWWANETAGHVHAKAWLDAGYETWQVDMAGRKLVFKRIPAKPTPVASGLNDPQRNFKSETPLHPRRHPAFGAMKGLIVIDPDLDLTKPAMPEWADLLDAKYGSEKSK